MVCRVLPRQWVGGMWLSRAVASIAGWQIIAKLVDGHFLIPETISMAKDIRTREIGFTFHGRGFRFCHISLNVDWGPCGFLG